MRNKLIILCILCLTISIKVSSQTGSTPPLNYDVKKIKPQSCEFNNMNLEQADTKAKEDFLSFGKGEAIILIARPGIKDKKTGLNTLIERRLYTAKAYLTDYLKKRPKESVLTAIAPNNGAEYGVIEIYVSGSLFYILAANPNFGLGVGSCDSPDSDDKESRNRRSLLYPWLYKNSVKN